jgi:hypothetical protein
VDAPIVHQRAHSTTRNAMREMMHSQATLEECLIAEGDQEKFDDLLKNYVKIKKPKKEVIVHVFRITFINLHYAGGQVQHCHHQRRLQGHVKVNL